MSQENGLYGHTPEVALFEAIDRFKAASAVSRPEFSAPVESPQWETEYNRIVSELDGYTPSLHPIFDYPAEPYEDNLPDVHQEFTFPEPKWAINISEPRESRPPTRDELGRPYLTRDLAGYGRYTWESLFAPLDPPKIDARKLAAAGTAFLALGAGILHDAPRQTSSESPVIDGIEVSYRADHTVVTVPELTEEHQDPAKSSVDAALAAEIDQDMVAIMGDKLILPADVNESTIVRAVIGASAKDGVETAETQIQPQTQEQGTTVTESTEPSKPIESMTDGEFIDWLTGQVKPSAEEYKSFDVDTSRVNVFADELSGERIEPKAFVGHWTGAVYPNGVDQFVGAIKNREGNCCSVMYFMDQNAKVYRFGASWEKMAHAYGANSFTQGVEIEARGLKDYTPEQMKAYIYLSYRFMTANDIPISRENFLGHQEVDQEYGRHQKPDMPKELVDKLFPLLQQLSQEIGQVATPEANSSNLSYQQALDTLLEEIRNHEGGWDAINRGEAGDTRQYGDAYFAALGGKKLSQLTIRQVLDLQSSGAIMAVGGYQFIPGTLRSAVEATGIDLNRLFDMGAQNELAVDYLLFGGKRPTLSAYLKGESDDIEKALEDMCMEWASIPCANGESYYKGTAGNDAAGGLKRREEIRGMLVAIRNGYQERMNPSQPEATLPINNKVVFIGDSLTVGYTRFGGLEQQDEANGLDVIVADGVGGRPLVGAEGSDDGVRAIEHHIDAIKQAGTVVIALGTNAPENEEAYQAAVEGAVERIHGNDVNPNAKIVFVKGYSYADGTRSAARRDARTHILDSVADPRPNVFVIDVKKVIQDGDFAGDHVHLTAGGYEKAVSEILKQVSQVAQQPNENQPKPEKVVPTEPTTTTTTTPATVTTQVPEPAAEQQTSRIIDDEIRVSRESALNIYRVYFIKDGVVDQDGLEAFVDMLPSREKDGQTRYSVGVEYIPGEYKPDVQGDK